MSDFNTSKLVYSDRDGVVSLIDDSHKSTQPIIKLLQRSYYKDPTCISGNIKYLLSNDEDKSREDAYL